MFKVLRHSPHNSIYTCNSITCIIFRPENDNREYSPTEISHGVKQLLMKYLPDEHLARISAKPKHQKCMDRDQKNEDIYDRKEAKPDFSIASLQYMKKYNLLPSGNFKMHLHFYLFTNYMY